MSETTQSELLELANSVLIRNYRQAGMAMARGRGSELWDASGRRYLDMTAGIAVCCLGHAHPKLGAAIAEQAGKLIHTSNLYFIEEQVRLAAELTARCFAERVFFCNSGAEANEGALKLARRYQHVIAKQPERNTVVLTLGSFHGRSIATVAITGQEKYREGFGPLFGPVEFVEFDDVDAAARVLRKRTACAFIVEPIQAEGGIVVPSPGYLAALRELCTETGTLLVFDEVQTGVGRTGKWFGHQHDNVEPDVMTLAKGLGGGVPIGAVLASGEAARGLAFVPGAAVPHASTFGGNALACAAARAVIETIETDGLLENCEEMGEYLGRALTGLARENATLCEGARGRGLLRGLTIREGAATTAAEVMVTCRERGVLLSVAGGRVVRFVPSLTVSREHLDEALGVLADVVGAVP